MTDATPDDDALLAAELAFGLLSGDGRIAAEARLASDPAFAADHGWWSDRAAALVAGPGVTPDERVWDAIVARLPANDVAVAGPDDGALRRQLRRWQVGAVAASLAALLLGLVAIPQRASPPPQPPIIDRPAPRLVALLSGEDRAGSVAVSYDPDGRGLLTVPAGLDPGGRATELWAIPADGRPRSLGVIAADTPGVPASRRAAGLLAEGVTLAVSLEPAGGSPTGAPTGPVILTGKLTRI